MRILAIETSCDETSCAIVDDGRIVQSNIIASSKGAFERSGGVIPEDAARQQITCIIPVIEQALEEAKTKKEEIDAVAVTSGPGLLGSLIVGTTTARMIANAWGKPLLGIHHTLGHLSSTWLLHKHEPRSDAPRFPILTLSASGGHTELWLRHSHTRGQLLGRTRDDAAGEAFDKGANLLGLPYPGGPAIARVAAEGNAQATSFPSPLRGVPGYDFSFSGIKTALRTAMREHPEGSTADLAASFQEAICRHLLDRTANALTTYAVREIHLVGGVSANERLRAMCAERCEHAVIRTPLSLHWCTDNAAMIAAAAEFLWREIPNAHKRNVVVNASIPLESAMETVENER